MSIWATIWVGKMILGLNVKGKGVGLMAVNLKGFGNWAKIIWVRV